MPIEYTAVDAAWGAWLSGAVRTELASLPGLIEWDGVQPVQSWAQSSRAFIDRALDECGALLFRGFACDSATRFEEIAIALAGPLAPYHSIAGPRKKLSERVYTASDYPPRRAIPLHPEGAYAFRFPGRLVFGCLRAPDRGGETPLADLRKIWGALSPSTQARFEALGVRYVNNYGSSFGKTWQDAFSVKSKAELEARCRALEVQTTWKTSGGLRTQAILPAVAAHPRSGAPIFFNQVLAYHVSSLGREVAQAMLSAYAQEELPMQSFWGDGRPFEDEVIEEVRAATEANTRLVSWRPGDILLADNLLVAHGRRPYEGQREVLVAMTELLPWSAVSSRSDIAP